MRCCLLGLAVVLVAGEYAAGQTSPAAPPPRPLEMVEPANDGLPPPDVLKPPTTSETAPVLQEPPAEWPPAPPAYAPQQNMPPTLMPQQNVPPASLSAPYNPVDAGPEISPYAERWRYMARNDVFWYFTPERKWMYWSQGRWVQYESPRYSNTPLGVQPPVVYRTRIGARVGGAINASPQATPYGYVYPNPYPGYYGGMGAGMY